MNRNKKALCFAITALLFTGAVGEAQQGVHTPPPGSPERRAIMDFMRMDAYTDRLDPAAAAHRNPDKVFLKVFFLKVHGDWALTDVLPVNAAGDAIAEPRWGLLHRKSGHWTDVDYSAAVVARFHYPDEAAADEVLDMTPVTVRRIWRVFPSAPRDIFPTGN